MERRLLTNNIVTSSLCSWWQEFQHFDLVHLRDLGQFIIQKEPGKAGSAIYAMEIDQFLKFQTVYQEKVLALLRHVWHRGCILILKKFKLLRTAHDQKFSKINNLQAKGKWTFKGFKPGAQDITERRWVHDEVMSQVQRHCYDGHMTKLQSYYMRAAAVHQNIHLNYHLIEEGLECADFLNQSGHQEDVGVDLLADIRDSSQHRKYVAQLEQILEKKENLSAKDRAQQEKKILDI